MQGVVRTVVDWGVFVALPEAENLEGLVHATEASHDPRARLGDHFKPGDKLEVKVVKVDERGKIWLSRRALVPDPWREAKEKYPAGSRLTTTITRVEKFGAFCQLDGVDGLLHVSDLSINRVEDINTVIKVGDTPSDLEEGKSAGCGLVVGVTRGSHTRAELAQHPHDMLLPTIASLPSALRSKVRWPRRLVA